MQFPALAEGIERVPALLTNEMAGLGRHRDAAQDDLLETLLARDLYGEQARGARPIAGRMGDVLAGAVRPDLLGRREASVAALVEPTLDLVGVQRNRDAGAVAMRDLVVDEKERRLDGVVA